MIKQFEFDRQKAIEVILYISTHLPEAKREYLRVLKLMYLADKTSLETYGRFVSSDSYVAMEHGPVPTESYDLVKEAKVSNIHGFTVENEYQICPIRSADEDELSKSDIATLDDIIQQYGSLPLWELRDKTHDDAWHEIWDASGEKRSVLIPIEKIANLSDHGEEIIELLSNPHE